MKILAFCDVDKGILKDAAGHTYIDDDDDNGTYGILSLCDQLYEKINRYLERDSDD